MATTERFVVDRDQAHRISKRIAELQRQVFLQNDTALDPERVIATLQGMTEGKLTPFASGLRGRFIRTMPILIGGVSKDDLIVQLGTATREISGYAKSMMNHKLFTTLAEPEMITLIDLCPADLGFTENPTTTELFDVKRLTAWSEANLDGHVLDLCPAETGPHLAIQYKDQPKGEVLWIAMERIPDSVGHPYVFAVERNDDGRLWLYDGWTSPDGRWGLDYRVVFRLRKVSSASAVLPLHCT